MIPHETPCFLSVSQSFCVTWVPASRLYCHLPLAGSRLALWCVVTARLLDPRSCRFPFHSSMIRPYCVSDSPFDTSGWVSACTTFLSLRPQLLPLSCAAQRVELDINGPTEPTNTDHYWSQRGLADNSILPFFRLSIQMPFESSQSPKSSLWFADVFMWWITLSH